MKKLSLSEPMVQKGEVLSRAQLKKVLGGDGSEGCVNACNSNCPCSDSRDWCDNGLCKERPRPRI